MIRKLIAFLVVVGVFWYFVSRYVTVLFHA